MKKTDKKSDLVIAGLLDYLSETSQTNLLPDVSKSLTRLFEDSEKAKEIVMTSVVELTPSQKEDFRKFIIKLLRVDLPIVNKLDKKLLGGLTVSVGDWFLDASLSRELINLKRTLLA